MASGTATNLTKRRFSRAIERSDGRDFPYYDGRPVQLVGWKWAVILLSCLIGFAVLLFYPAANNVQMLVSRVLFPAIPLAVFVGLTGRYWRALFGRISGADLLTMLAFFLLNLAVTFGMGAIVMKLFGANANTAADGIFDHGPAETIAFYAGTGIQLFGEEVFTILPFLSIMYFLHAKMHLSRNTSVLLAWLVTAVGFGAAHLPTYGWNFAQAFLVIGAARLVLTLAYIRTKNILVSTGAHILNDWVIFTVTALAAGAAAAA